MCLHINRDQKLRDMSNNLLKKKIRHGHKRFWKLYYIRKNGEIYTYFQNAPVKVDENGYINSDRDSVELSWREIEYKQVEKGIHVYTDERVDNGLVANGVNYFRVKAHSSDLVAVSACKKEAVFMRIKFDDENAFKLLAKLKKKRKNRKS